MNKLLRQFVVQTHESLFLKTFLKLSIYVRDIYCTYYILILKSKKVLLNLIPFEHTNSKETPFLLIYFRNVKKIYLLF